MLSVTARLNFARTLGSQVMLGVMLFFCTAYAQAGQVSLAWDANTEPTLGGYQLYYGQTSGNYTANADVGNQTSYTLTGLQEGTTYYFAAKAYDTTRTTSSGFSNEVSTTIASTTAPTANFSANPTAGTAPLTVTFTDTSTGNVTAWSWSFGDGSSSTAKTAVKTYANPGTYTVSLTVTGAGGNDTATKIISATAAAPVANFSASPTSGRAPLAVTFTNSSSGNVTSYSWNFGDGSTSTGQNPVHTYATAGTYSVILTATGPSGTNTKTRTGYITVSSGPVATYNFEEVSGTKVIDASGKGNHGTGSGTSRITQGRFGKALSFDGLNDWVTVNDAASLDLTTGMTLEAWVYPTESMTGWRTLVIKESPPDRASYYLYANSNTDQPATGAFISSYQGLQGGPWLLPNTWVHLAGTYDGTTQRLYVNGTEVAKRAQSGLIAVSGGVLRIGGESIWGEFFKGRIDEIRVYNRALSAAEITTDMNISVATSSPPVFLVGDKNVAPVTDSIPQGKAQAFQTQAAVTGWVTGLSVYVDTGPTAIKLVAGLYTDKNGHPGTLLAQGILGSPGSAGWKRVSLPPVSITAGSKYWVAILSPSGMLTFRDSGTSVGGLSETSSQSTLTKLPSTWTTGTYEFEGPLSAYGAGYQ